MHLSILINSFLTHIKITIRADVDELSSLCFSAVLPEVNADAAFTDHDASSMRLVGFNWPLSYVDVPSAQTKVLALASVLHVPGPKFRISQVLPHVNKIFLRVLIIEHKWSN